MYIYIYVYIRTFPEDAFYLTSLRFSLQVNKAYFLVHGVLRISSPNRTSETDSEMSSCLTTAEGCSTVGLLAI